MTTNTKTAPAQKIGHSKADSTGKKAEAPKATKPEATEQTTESPAEQPAAAAPEEPTPARPVAAFVPKPAEKAKSKQSQKDFVHAHIGPDRLKEIQKLQDTTNYSRTELIQQAWDHFVAQPDVAKFLK